MTNILTGSIKESKVKSGSGSESAECTEILEKGRVFTSTLPASSPCSSSSCPLQRTFQSDPGGRGSSSSGPARRRPVQSCLQMPWL